MGFEGGDLTAWFREGDEISKTTLYAMAERGRRAFQDNVRRFTPVDTGALRESIQVQPIHPLYTLRGSGFETGVISRDPKAPWVEHGTHPHTIVAHGKAMAIPTPDGLVFAKVVHHPGTRGAHMFARGAAATEAEFELTMRPEVDAWQLRTEAAMRRSR